MSAGRILALMGLTFAVGIFVLYLLTGCSGSQSQRVESALDASFEVLGVSIDSASTAAREACVARQEAVLQRVRSGQSTTAQSEPELRKIQTRCNEVRETFGLIRTLYNQAVGYRKSDALEQAKKKLEEVKAIWREIMSDNQVVEATP